LASIRPYQVRFVDKVLEHSLGYHHVLYCIGNESSAPLAWTLHWTDRLRDRAREAGETVLVTAMLAGGRLQPVLQRPARFGYIEACKLLGPRRQSWAPRGAQQFDRIAETVRAASEEGRPVNAVKIICNVDDEVDAYSVRKFWRGLMAGLGAVRFHRPPAGSGLNQAATNAIAAARLANERVPFHLSRARPDLLSNCEPDEAYVRAAPRRGYLVYFPRGGAVSLDPGAGEDIHHGAWLDIAAGRVRSEFDVTGEGPAELRTPSDGPWAAVAQVRARYSMGPANAALPGRNTCVSR
jgi:hypothetical protein